MTARGGILSLAVSFRAVKTSSDQWNAWGFDDDGVLCWECLHLHESRSQALTCAINADRRAMAERGELEDDEP